MGVVHYQRSGCPDMDVHTSPFEPLSHLLGPPGPSTVRSSATKTFKAALRSYGYLGRDRQRSRGFFSGMVRGVSNPRGGSKMLSFLYQPRLVCSSPLHLRSAWTVNSAKLDFRFTEFSEVRRRQKDLDTLVTVATMRP